ncbi:MAG: NAD(+)/NADH kinase [Bacteroidota bacterium]
MKIGIIPNVTKPDILNVVSRCVEDIRKNDLEYVVSNSMLKFEKDFNPLLKKSKFLKDEELIQTSDFVLSIGGDGTMLTTAYLLRNYSTPLLGVNIGKLGFLAELDVESFDSFIDEIKAKTYTIEERMALIGKSEHNRNDELYAINDIVIDKGPWQKMIEMTIKVDNDYVSTFSADGIVIATPTGSTGYSLSTGGPIVNPKANVIALSPIAPHTLNMRPLVLSSDQRVTIIVNSPHEKIQVSCDGQRVYTYSSPAIIYIQKSDKPVNLVHSSKTNYFEILRNKLYWGLDVRKTNNSK